MRKWKDLTNDEKFVRVMVGVSVGLCGYAVFDMCKSLKVLKHLKHCKINLEAGNILVDSKAPSDRLLSMYFWGRGVDDIVKVSDSLDAEDYKNILNEYAHLAEDILSNPIDVQ